MSEEKKTEAEADSAEDARSHKDRVGDGIRQGIGVLSAFRDALEETIQEARERGDLSTDRAKEVIKEALDKAQTAAEGAREKLDFATQADMEGVSAAVDSLRSRISSLEESVFGKTAADDESSGPAAEEENDGAMGG